jgi:thioredoxin 1
MPVTTLTDSTFQTYLLSSPTPVLVNFTAEWCKPCKPLGVIVEQLSVEWASQLTVGRLDVDQNLEATMQFGVQGIPTLILFKGGQPVERVTGFIPKAKLEEKLKRHLAF